MSEFTKNEVRHVVADLAEKLGVSPEEIHVAMAAVVGEYVGEWVALVAADRRKRRRKESNTTSAASSPVDQPSSSRLQFQEAPHASVAASSQTPLQQDSNTLTEALLLCMSDLPSAMDKYLTEPMLHCMWLSAHHHPELQGKRIEGVAGVRCSGESIVIALALASVFERKQRSSILYAREKEEDAERVTLEVALGVDFASETDGGGAVEYIERLLEARFEV